MKNVMIKTICICLIVVAFAEYNVVTASRLADEAVSGAQAAQAVPAEGASSAEGTQAEQTAQGAGYKDGTYRGSAQGYGGTITVEVTIENGSITRIDAVEHSGEDAAYWNMCSGVIPQLIETQGENADTVSGATFSSSGIINATIEALSQAM